MTASIRPIRNYRNTLIAQAVANEALGGTSKDPGEAGCSWLNRRQFLQVAAASVVATRASEARSAAQGEGLQSAGSLGQLRQIEAGVLDVGYYESGEPGGPPVLLLHGFPYDVHSYERVAPVLSARGCRVIVPYLRGHGSTRFLDADAPRSGQQAALGADLVALMDALGIRGAVLAGYDWGGRAACVVAALWPERCTGLVSVNGYLVQDIAKASQPLAPAIESGLWYQFYFQTERGRIGLSQNRREIARLQWTRNSPLWKFDAATFERSASAFETPDYVDVVIHSYRHRLGLAPGYAPYEGLERRLAALPVIAAPTITLDGGADGVVPATDGSSMAARFTGKRQHRVIAKAGHNLPQEAPDEFSAAVLELVAASDS
jgi:pimeloyl-ACP methyl ester carboxylesterase